MPPRRALGTPTRCWDLYEQLTKARRARESAERQFTTGTWPKGKTREQAADHLRRLEEKAHVLDAEILREGC